MDYIQFCKNYFSITGIPVNYASEQTILYSTLSNLMHTDAESPATFILPRKIRNFTPFLLILYTVLSR